MRKVQENDRFGNLLLVKRVENENGHQTWLARCDCGVEKPIRLQKMTSGKTTSCGCVGLSRLTGVYKPGGEPKPEPAPQYRQEPDPEQVKRDLELARLDFQRDPEERLAACQPHKTAWLKGYPREQHAARMQEAWAILRRLAAGTGTQGDRDLRAAAEMAIVDGFDFDPDPQSAQKLEHIALVFQIKEQERPEADF